MSVQLADLSDENIEETVNLKTGVAVGEVPIFNKRESQVKPNSPRWIFNPFVVVDLTNEPAAYSTPFIRNIVFNKIESVPTNVKAHRPFDYSGATGPSGQNAEYDRIDRTAYQQTGDILDRHSDKGVIAIDALFEQSDELASLVNVLLFGDEVECVRDMHVEAFPCPVLPDVLEAMDAHLQSIPVEHSAVVKAAAVQIQAAIRQAMKYARTVIGEAQKRIVDEKSVNRTFSPSEERCFLALGEEIPRVLPYLTKSQAAGRGVDLSGLGSEIAAGIREGMREMAPVATIPNQPATLTIGPAIGDEVSVGGQTGVIVQKPFGKVTVEFEDGSKKTVSKEELN